jgi:hypothetical protein
MSSYVDSTKPSILIETPTPNPFHKRFLNVFSDFVFLDDGYSVVTRDFLTVKVAVPLTSVLGPA